MNKTTEEKLWHDIKEEHKKNGDILFTDGDETVLESYSVFSSRSQLIGIVYDRRDRCQEWEFASRYWKRWCYVEDILRIE